MVTRRQFGVWATSALLLGPSAARAGDPIDAITLSASIKQRAKEGGLTLDLYADNKSRKGVSAMVDVGEVSFAHGEETKASIAWMNDNNPYSRRINAPSFVDIPSDETTFCGVVNTAIPAEWADKKGLKATFTVRIHDGQGKTRTVELTVALDEASSEPQS